MWETKEDETDSERTETSVLRLSGDVSSKLVEPHSVRRKHTKSSKFNFCSFKTNKTTFFLGEC